MKHRKRNLRKDHQTNDYKNDILFYQKYFDSQSGIKYSEVLHFLNSHLSSNLNLSVKEKLSIQRECLEIFSLSHRSTEIDENFTLKPMSDKTAHPRTSQTTKVKKSTRKSHSKKSNIPPNQEDLISNFPQTNFPVRSKRAWVPRTRRSVQTKKEDSNIRLKVRFSLKTSVPTNRNNDDFLRHLAYQLAKRMRVPMPSINDLTVISGSNVTFTLTSFNDENNAMDEQSVFEAADFLKTKIQSEQLRLTDLNGQLLMTSSSAYISKEDNTFDFSLVILVVLCITLVMIIALIIAIVYISRRLTRVPKPSTEIRNRPYRNMEFGRDSSQSIGKYSYDSGLWLGPGPEPAFTVPDAPYYRPPTVEQIASTPRPITAVRTRLKRNWDVDERALSTIPDDYDTSIMPQRRNRRS